MKLLTCMLLLLLPTKCFLQVVEIEGKAKITNLEKSETEDSVLVKLPGNLIGVRGANAYFQHQILSISNDTIYLSDGGFVVLPPEKDKDSTNELITHLSVVGDSLRLIESTNIYSLPMDSSNTNELQSLSLSGATISISDSPQSITLISLGCESGFTPVAGGRICIQNTLQPASNMHQAIQVCQSQGPGSRVCTHNDFLQACASGFDPFGGQLQGWFSDKVTMMGGNGDDEYATWNRNFCDPNIDAIAQHAVLTTLPFRCCY